ncbi:UBX domain-containing protein 4-like [Leguminivora glycinivorella]|uniref:UBX domain-containing protein 4-like n=1 Tax=Leguminivora glycinivorella TaxID=1035111 RepID=UPI00200FA992|nr:UBX domain-containing protein 4-like [Leguminivora glycinivorella]
MNVSYLWNGCVLVAPLCVDTVTSRGPSGGCTFGRSPAAAGCVTWSRAAAGCVTSWSRDCAGRPVAGCAADSASAGALRPHLASPVVAQWEPEEKLAASESTLSAEEKMERAKALIEAKRKEKAEKEKQEDRKREKMENNLARQRILEQIAQDRAERRARDVPPQECQRRETTAPATSGDGALQARVQFKLPDGTTHTNHFPAEARLAEVHQYVADNLDLPTAQFSLWLAFPRRELTDTEATLRRLELAPLVTQLLSTMIFEPSTRLYTWLVSLAAPAGARAPPPPPRAPATAPAAARRGNVHRLRGERPDDDNNTWNGNSTQQM